MSTFFISMTIYPSIYLYIYLSTIFEEIHAIVAGFVKDRKRVHTKIFYTCSYTTCCECIFAHMPFHENRKAYTRSCSIYTTWYIGPPRIDIWVTWMTYTKPRNNSHKYPVKCLEMIGIKRRKTRLCKVSIKYFRSNE